MGIGYACLAVGVPDSKIKNLTLRRVSDQTLLQTCKENIAHLKNLISYTKAQNIPLFRISSDLIPFGSSEANTLLWWDIFADELAQIGALAKEGGIRLSMHPGQYTVLNSPKKEVVHNAIEDLVYHSRVLTSLGYGTEGKIVLHIGGVYGEKERATKRFITTYHTLPDEVKARLILENDDKLYTISEVLAIGEEVGAPVVFDNLHHAINPSAEPLSESEWIAACAHTWKASDGKQKIHYSQQDPLKRPGSHSTSIALDPFLLLYGSLQDPSIDIMLEVKDKNISALKCMHAINGTPKRELIEQWRRYKALVTERDLSKVLEVEELLDSGDEQHCLALAFYHTLEEILALEVSRAQAAITASSLAKLCVRTPSEEKRIEKRIAEYKNAKIPLDKLKLSIMKLAEKHSVDELLYSYYFVQ